MKITVREFTKGMENWRRALKLASAFHLCSQNSRERHNHCGCERFIREELNSIAPSVSHHWFHCPFCFRISLHYRSNYVSVDHELWVTVEDKDMLIRPWFYHLYR